jgi:hypothetical protein
MTSKEEVVYVLCRTINKKTKNKKTKTKTKNKNKNKKTKTKTKKQKQKQIFYCGYTIHNTSNYNRNKPSMLS